MFHLSRLRCIFLLGVPSFFPPFKVLKAEFRNQACQPFHQTNTWEESWKSCSFSQDPTVPLILYHYLYIYIYIVKLYSISVIIVQLLFRPTKAAIAFASQTREWPPLLLLSSQCFCHPTSPDQNPTSFPPFQHAGAQVRASVHQFHGISKSF